MKFDCDILDHNFVTNYDYSDDGYKCTICNCDAILFNKEYYQLNISENSMSWGPLLSCNENIIKEIIE